MDTDTTPHPEPLVWPKDPEQLAIYLRRVSQTHRLVDRDNELEPKLTDREDYQQRILEAWEKWLR